MNPSPRWMAYSTSPELTPVFWLAARTRTGMLADKFCSQTLTQSLTPKTHVNSDWVRVCDLLLYPNEKTNKQNKIILARSISGRAAKSRRRFLQLQIANFSFQSEKLFTLKWHWISSQPRVLNHGWNKKRSNSGENQFHMSCFSFQRYLFRYRDTAWLQCFWSIQKSPRSENDDNKRLLALSKIRESFPVMPKCPFKQNITTVWGMFHVNH